MQKQRCRSLTAKLVSALVFTTQIVQSLYFPNPKFQASSHLVWLYSLICVGPGRKPRRPVFSQRGSFLRRNAENDPPVFIKYPSFCWSAVLLIYTHIESIYGKDSSSYLLTFIEIYHALEALQHFLLQYEVLYCEYMKNISRN